MATLVFSTSSLRAAERNLMNSSRTSSSRCQIFKIKTDMDAAEPLRKLGVRRVFNQDAELEGISSAPISVSRIKHTSLVEVTKEGTEGAAATGVEIALFSAAFGEQKDVVVDRPFIFIVQDKKNHIPVLVGKITDPTQNVI